MPLLAKVDATIPSEAARVAFVHQNTAVFERLSQISRARGIPEPEVLALLTDDFASECVARSSTPTESKYVEPWGAMPLPQTHDWSVVTVVFDGKSWGGDFDEPSGRAKFYRWCLAGHELAHVVLGRALYASGAMETEPSVPIAGWDVARSISRVIVSEYRAERLGAELAAEFCESGGHVSGEDIPPVMWRVVGNMACENLAILLRRTEDGWPRLVEAYRSVQVSLPHLWAEVVRSTETLLKHLVWPQAQADAAGQDESILDMGFLADGRNTVIFGDSMRSFLDALRSAPVLPPQHATLDDDRRFVAAGEMAITETWARFGLWFDRSERDSGQFFLHVD